MSAVAITHKKTGELKLVLIEKSSRGKNKMTVLNAMRAKLVAIMSRRYQKKSNLSTNLFYRFTIVKIIRI